MADAYGQQARPQMQRLPVSSALFDCQANSKFWISKQEYQECGAGHPDITCQNRSLLEMN